MTKRIMIVSNSYDIHADYIIPIIHKKSYRTFRINIDEFPKDYQLTQYFGNKSAQSYITHIPSGDTIKLADIGAVWMRKTADYGFITDELTQQERIYAAAEAEHTLFGLLYSLDCYWVSHPLAIRSAQFKSEQLNRAYKMGFTIPESIISNAPSDVISFKNALNSDMIFKAMSSSDLCASEVEDEQRQNIGITTTVIDDLAMENIDSVVLTPCHFQGYVEKEYELRVTVIENNVFAAKIDSQLDERTKIDFRDFSVDIPYTAVSLPQNIAQRCIDYISSYGLNYGALDLIVTQDERYVFLENNPGGQFLFVEQLVPELKIAECLAECLIGGAKR